MLKTLSKQVEILLAQGVSEVVLLLVGYLKLRRSIKKAISFEVFVTKNVKKHGKFRQKRLTNDQECSLIKE